MHERQEIKACIGHFIQNKCIEWGDYPVFLNKGSITLPPYYTQMVSDSMMMETRGEE